MYIGFNASDNHTVLLLNSFLQIEALTKASHNHIPVLQYLTERSKSKSSSLGIPYERPPVFHWTIQIFVIRDPICETTSKAGRAGTAVAIIKRSGCKEVPIKFLSEISINFNIYYEYQFNSMYKKCLNFIQFWMFLGQNRHVPDRMQTGTDMGRLGGPRRIAFISTSSPKIWYSPRFRLSCVNYLGGYMVDICTYMWMYDNGAFRMEMLVAWTICNSEDEHAWGLLVWKGKLPSSSSWSSFITNVSLGR